MKRIVLLLLLLLVGQPVYSTQRLIGTESEPAEKLTFTVIPEKESDHILDSARTLQLEEGESFVFTDGDPRLTDSKEKQRIIIDIWPNEVAVIRSRSPLVVNGEYDIVYPSRRLKKMLGSERIKAMKLPESLFTERPPVKFLIAKGLDTQSHDKIDVIVMSADKRVMITNGGVFYRDRFKPEDNGIAIKPTEPAREKSNDNIIMWNRIIFGMTILGLMIILAGIPWYIITYGILNNFVYGGKTPFLVDYLGRNMEDEVPTDVAMKIYLVCFIIAAYPAFKIAWGWFKNAL